MDKTLSKRERSLEKNRGLGPWLVAAMVLVIVLAVTGCARTLERSMATCAALDGSWDYTRAEGVEKFSCQRPAAVHTRAVSR